MNTEENTYAIAPYSSLAHLGCAALVLLLAFCSSLGLVSAEFHTWLMIHPYTMPLGFLAALVAAYLLEYTLTTAAMLTLLVISFACGGLALCSFNLEAEHALPWLLAAGPLGYFLTAALTLHLQQESLYRWQMCCIFIAGAALLPVLAGLLMGESFPMILLSINMGLVTAAYELYIFFGRKYSEITSDTRLRSTAIAMVMLTTVPICKSIWYSLYYSRELFTVLFRLFFRWWW